MQQNPTIDEETLREATRRLETASGCRVRTLDVFYYHEYPQYIADRGGRARSFSYGDSVYLNNGGILAKFFQKHGSLAKAHGSSKQFGPINSESGENGEKRRGYYLSDVPDYAFSQGTSIEQLAAHLAEWDFGKSFAIFTLRHPVRAIQVQLSVFVVFDQKLEDNAEARVSEWTLWWILSKVSHLITETFSTQAARAREEKGLAVQMVGAVRHLIQNIPFKANLAGLSRALEKGDVSKAKRIYKSIEKQELLRDIATNLIYSFDSDPEELLLARKQLTTFTRIIDLMIQGHQEPDRIKVVGVDEEIQRHPANSISISRLVDTFVAVQNIWSNAISSNSDILVRYSRDPKTISVEFVNSGEMPLGVADYLNGKTELGPSDCEGIYHLRRAVDRNPLLYIFASIEDGKTIVKLVSHETAD